METVGSGEQTASEMLQWLCRSDPAPWCFIPLGESVVSCCSVSFLSFWDLPAALCPAGRESIPIRGGVLEAAIRARGLKVDFLMEAAAGKIAGFNPVRCLTGNDRCRYLVSCSPVLKDDGLPGGCFLWIEVESGHSFGSELRRTRHSIQELLKMLSPREHQVLSLLYDGKTNKAIAFITGISEKTVEKHRARIMLKLNVNSTAELIRLVCYAERIHKPQTNDNDLSAENS